MVPHARIGGKDGMRLCRAAFAVMLKFSGSFKHFQEIRDEIAFTIDANADMTQAEQLKAFEND
jgi:hypothetical protein